MYTVTDFVNSMLLSSDCFDPITLEEAAYDLQNMIDDDVELPEGITPESYMTAWNIAVGEDITEE